MADTETVQYALPDDVGSLAAMRKSHEKEADEGKIHHQKELVDERAKHRKETAMLREEHMQVVEEKNNYSAEQSEEKVRLQQDYTKKSVELDRERKKVSDLEEQLGRNLTIVEFQKRVEKTRAGYDEVLDELKQQFNSKLLNDIYQDCEKERDSLTQQLNSARSAIATQQWELDTKSKELADVKETLKAKTIEMKECLEEERKKIKGQNDDHVKLLVDHNNKIVIDLNREIERLKSLHRKEKEEIEAKLVTNKESLALEKKRLEDEYDRFKKNFIESLKAQRGQECEEIRKKEEEIKVLRTSNYEETMKRDKQVNELKLALKRLTEEQTISEEEHFHANEILEEENTSLKSKLSEKKEEIRVLRAKLSRFEKSMKMSP